MRNLETALRRRWLDLAIAASLFLVVLGVYAPVRYYGFVDYDDYFYVSQNQHVLSGLNAGSVRWAFTSTEFANWFPLTWISLMADRQFFAAPEEMPPSDVRAGALHRTNVILHAAATLLLFALLKRMTGATGPSLLAAFLFGLHPLRVESVAWVSERKDVLSGVFWMLALHSYVSYARRPRAWSYLLTLLLYGLGFLAKPMVVTLPLILVLLDFWPLRRLNGARGQVIRRIVWEKLPFYVLALAMALITYGVQRSGGAVRTFDELPLAARLANAVVSAAVYIAKTVWPMRLAVLYPLPMNQPAWQVIVAGLVLAGITLLSLRTIRTRPYLAVGWLWYLIAILPVIGIVQVGLQARADRYTYLPTIGLILMLVWSGEDAWRQWPKARPVLAGLCGAACVASVALTARQIPYWADSVALFRHTIEVTGPNAIAHGYLGDVWKEQVMYEEAASEYRKGLAIAPHNIALLVNLGDVLGLLGRPGDAIAPLAEAMRLQPGDAVIRNALGEALVRAGRIGEAVAQFSEAVRIQPDNAAARQNLQAALAVGEQPENRR